MTSYPEELLVRTDKGSFHLTLSPYRNRDTSTIETYTISIGSKDTKCIQLTIPTREMPSTVGHLLWVQSDTEYSLEKFCEKGFAQHILSLGCTIARDMNPQLDTLYLDDTSSFTCALPGGAKHKVPMKEFHLAFHRATWYEYYFKATLRKDHSTYLALKENFMRAKPPTFSFVHPDLQEELQELYKGTDTWHAFFEQISSRYGKKKCAVVYPWITNAMYSIFDDNNIFDNIKWQISLSTIPLVEFNSYTVARGGSKRGTRRVSRSRRGRSHTEFPYFFLDLPTIKAWKYREFLEGRPETSQKN